MNEKFFQFLKFLVKHQEHSGEYKLLSVKASGSFFIMKYNEPQKTKEEEMRLLKGIKTDSLFIKIEAKDFDPVPYVGASNPCPSERMLLNIYSHIILKSGKKFRKENNFD